MLWFSFISYLALLTLFFFFFFHKSLSFFNCLSLFLIFSFYLFNHSPENIHAHFISNSKRSLYTEIETNQSMNIYESFLPLLFYYFSLLSFLFLFFVFLFSLISLYSCSFCFNSDKAMGLNALLAFINLINLSFIC